MDNLPIEMIFHIFRYINVADLITCRLVCRKFKYVAEQKKVDELIVNKQMYDWFYSKKKANPNCVIGMDKILFASPAFRLEQNVRRLRIEFKGTFYSLTFINSLKQLEELDISFRLGRGTFKFALPNLRILRADCYDFDTRMKLAFETPKLEAVRCAYLDDLRIENPLTVRYYEGDYYDEDVQMFPNLEVLKINRVEPDSFDRDLLTTFANLKELWLNWTCLSYDWQCAEDAYAMNAMAHIMKQKLVLRRTDFRLHMQGVEIKDKNLFVDNAYLNDQDFQMRNYALLDQAPVFNGPAFDYCDLMKLNSKIPADFFRKFPCIRRVKVKASVADGDQLIGFLRSAASSLISLHLTNAGLSQAHYNQLPALANLESLKIDEETLVSYKFVLKMNRLSVLKVKREFGDAFGLAMRKFKRSKKFNDFEWKVAGDSVLVKRCSSDRRLFSLMWFQKQGEPADFQIKLNRELLTASELTTFYTGLVCKTGPTTRQRATLLSKQWDKKAQRYASSTSDDSSYYYSSDSDSFWFENDFSDFDSDLESNPGSESDSQSSSDSDSDEQSSSQSSSDSDLSD